MKHKNQVNVIYPYRTHGGTWVYDDPDVPVFAEAFVMGSSELIDHFVGEKAMKFTAYISSKPLPRQTLHLVNIDKGGEIQGWYRLVGTDMENWLCGHVLDYFEGYPQNIYVSIENIKYDR